MAHLLSQGRIVNHFIHVAKWKNGGENFEERQNMEGKSPPLIVVLKIFCTNTMWDFY
jgi:hypothetical protein